MKKCAVMVLILVFAFGSTVALAQQWLVVKDNKGVCKINKTKAGSPTIVGGPYPTKEAAEKALKETCPEAAQKPADKKKDKK